MISFVTRCGVWVVLAILGLVGNGARAGERTVVVMLFDGFAPAYIEDFQTPNFDRMREEGAFTHRMDPAFPTISLINGVTISTGCWPEHHGIVTNKFIDPERGVYDHSADADWLTGCEHMHQAAE
ncbi:MAG TPA: alkaline phosphatase family protein, partial [Myxococcota bacterium]